MLNPKEIEKYVVKTDTSPDSFDNIEIHLFFVFQDILSRYTNGRITKEQAGILKKQAINNYIKDKAVYEIYEHYVGMIAKTERLRIELRKEKRLETALKLIELYSGEEGLWNIW